MSKTNTEKMAPETQTPEMANGMKLDVRVRPIAPMGNLLAFANVTIGGCFKIDGFRICSSEKGLYVNMPATQERCLLAGYGRVPQAAQRCLNRWVRAGY